MDKTLERIAADQATGVLALFSGKPGSGKHEAARGVAGRLGSAIEVVDLSALVRGHLGEAEEHIDAVFAKAGNRGVVLFFDEADALFGKRTDVRDAHDRYANLEVGYLLERIEAYRGLVILATNNRANLDKALVSQCRYVLDFPRRD